MRWRALVCWGCFDINGARPAPKEHYGFKSPKTPKLPKFEDYPYPDRWPRIKEEVKMFQKFEEALFEIPKKVKFRRWGNELQDQMRRDLRNIKRAGRVVVKGDKTRNYYSVAPEFYDRVLQKNIANEYTEAGPGELQQVNEEAAGVAAGLQMDDRVEEFQKQDAFVNFKDHKRGFSTAAPPEEVPVRLISPSKSQLGVIAKVKLQKLNATVRAATGVHQWTETKQAIKWFEGLPPPSKSGMEWVFFQFDFCSFYSSIKPHLFKKALIWAMQLVEASEEVHTEDLKLCMAASKSFLHYRGKDYKKKQDPNRPDTTNFDITMGSFHGAEVCELVGLYLLQKLIRDKVFTKEQVGLYRDDGLAAVQVSRGKLQKYDNIRKRVHALVQKEGLTVEVEKAKRGIDYLDVSLDLVNRVYTPYTKPGDNLIYVDTRSNHPPSVFRAVPKGVAHRIATNSSSYEVFENAKAPFMEALRRSNYAEGDLREAFEYANYPKGGPPKPKRKRKGRNTTYVVIPWSSGVRSNVLGMIKALINFPQGTILSKAFNNNRNVKYSYGVAKSIGRHIMSSNRRVLQGGESPLGHCGDNPCRERQQTGRCWERDGYCNAKNVVYGCWVTPLDPNNNNLPVVYKGQPRRLYGGCTVNFKQRVAAHRTSFNPSTRASNKNSIAQLNAKKRKETKLAAHIWELRDQGLNYSTEWFIQHRAHRYHPGAKYCGLCVGETAEILFSDEAVSLNSRDELHNGCVHKWRHKLQRFNRQPP